jgi:hypothetical protein
LRSLKNDWEKLQAYWLVAQWDWKGIIESPSGF